MELHGVSRKYNISVWGYPAMRDVDTMDPKYYFDLDMMMYTSYWIDYSKNNVKQFNQEFRRKFLSEPAEKSYAWQGFDIAYYFLSGLAINGKSFIKNPEVHNPELLQSKFDFVSKSRGDGFENQKLFLIWYTKDYEIKLVE
jgi:hypothetical protein